MDGAQTGNDGAMIHTGCPIATHCKAAAECVCGTLAAEEQAKINKSEHWQREGVLYDFVSLSVETHGRLGRARMHLVLALGARAAGASRALPTKAILEWCLPRDQRGFV